MPVRNTEVARTDCGKRKSSSNHPGMPFYEITLIPRPLARADLVKVIHRVVSAMLDRGAVVTSLENLGHKDLPYRRQTKPPVERVFTANYFLVGCHMPVKVQEEMFQLYKNDRDLVSTFFADTSQKDIWPEVPASCDLEDMFQVPAKRQTVEDLRKGQKMQYYSQMRIYKKMEEEWRKIPKSYFIAPSKE